MVQSKISIKFFKIVTYIALVILIISSFIAFTIMNNIEKDTQIMIKDQLAVKLENKINSSFKLGITNAVTISQNEQIKLALKNMDKQKAYDILKNLTKVYSGYANYQNNKVHIHTHDIKSFLRSWTRNHNGDDLSSFRHTINTVKETRKPVLGIEVGYADLVIRAIVPIIENMEYLGSLEFIQDFGSIQKGLKEENKYLFSLIDINLLKNKPKHNHVIGKYAITQKNYNDEFFNKLKTIDFNKLLKKGYMNIDDHFYSVIPIVGFNDSFIGYYVIGQEYEHVQQILSQSKEIAYMFILLMVFMAMIIIVAINITIKKLIITNLTRVSDGLSSFFSFLNKKSQTIEKINIVAKDEIGQMANEINSNIEFITTLIDEEKKQNWISDGLQGLNKKLSGDSELISVSNKSISYLCKYLKAGIGALYIYNHSKKELYLHGSYAFVQRNDLSNSFKLGVGTVGQVALQKSPIQLENIQQTTLRISTGTTNEAPLNTYTFPLIYQDELYGVIELGSSLLFNETQNKFFDLSNTVIATALFSSIQNNKVRNLLLESEEVNTQLKEQQGQLELSNSQMQEQQAELEEANSQMEEQQVQLKESEKELKTQNQELEIYQKSLDKKANDLEESNRYKSEFLANMSHELRTPLNSVILLSSMLKENKKDNLTKEDIKKASIINSSGEELLRLINDVLDLSKVEAGRMELIVDKFHSSTFVTSVKDLFESSIDNKGLKFIIEDRYNNIISNDEDKLSQIIRNFLSNSLKFTHDGHIKLMLESDDSNRVKISVEDTGIGIAKNKQNIVFQAFQQADGSTSRKYGGTGLGLSITKELVSLMKGTINLESKEEEGSIFSISIPNIVSNDDTNKIENTSIPIEQSKFRKTFVESIINDDFDKITKDDKPFIIIEDNETFAATLRDVINDKGDLALIATTGTKGLELANKFDNIQGILLDLGLPDIDGIEILKKLKENVKTKKIPVYIISGRDTHNYKNFYGALGFKQKPLSKDDLNNVFLDFSKLNDKKIKDLLVVEDNDIQREAMIEFISDDSIKTYGVGSIDEAIDEIKKDKYDAIIVDLTLNGKSGLLVCEYIKKNNLTLPIIVYTGKELTQEEENKIKQYTDSIVIKSTNSQNRLLEEVDMFLHRVKKTAIKQKSIATDDINFNDKKIMVVDDDMRNTFVLVEILESRGAEVITATNGQEALEILDNNIDTNIILMDVMMPIMDGYETISKIREDDKVKDIPIIAVTAKAMQKDKERCFEVGANDYLTKPLNLDTFVGVVKAWIK